MNEENLKLDASPDLYKKPSIVSGGKTLNKKPIIIIAVGVLLLLLGLGYAAAKRGETNTGSGEQTEKEQTKSDKDGKVQLESMVSDLETNHKKGGFDTNQTAQNTDPLAQHPNQGTATIRPGDPMTPNNPPALVNPNGQRQYNAANGGVSDKQRMIDEKRKLLISAINSSSKIKVDGENNGQTNSSSGNRGLGDLSVLSALSGLKGGSQPDLLKQQMSIQEQQLANADTIDNQGRNDTWMNKADNKSYDYLEAKKVAPKSPYEVKAGTVIPGIMITGVNSDLPGQLLGVVSENVYDTGTGQHLLIPQGSKLVGIYSANVVFGQSRVMVAWNRIIFPDAKSINLSAMPGTDQAGYSGFSDQVDNHYMRIFGSAFMMSAITGGIAISSHNSGSQYTQTPSDQMISAMVTQMGEVGKQLMQKNLRIAPTLEIRPGYKFNIFVTKDMILEPLKY